MAVKAVLAIPGLEFAFVHMVMPYPDRPAESQDWVVKKIETSPSVVAFHFPWQGEPCRLARQVIDKLCFFGHIRRANEV